MQFELAETYLMSQRRYAERAAARTSTTTPGIFKITGGWPEQSKLSAVDARDQETAELLSALLEELRITPGGDDRAARGDLDQARQINSNHKKTARKGVRLKPDPKS